MTSHLTVEWWAWVAVIAFILAMLAGIILYVVGTAFPMTDREVIHLIVSVGIGAALIRFGMLERRGDTIG